MPSLEKPYCKLMYASGHGIPINADLSHSQEIPTIVQSHQTQDLVH